MKGREDPRTPYVNVYVHGLVNSRKDNANSFLFFSSSFNWLTLSAHNETTTSFHKK